MTRHHPSDRLPTSRPLRLLPWLALGAVLMLAAPATAQLSAVGQATGTVEGAVQLPPAPELPSPQVSTNLDLQQQVSIDVPDIDIEGQVYSVLSATQMARFDASAHLCSQLGSQVAPLGLSSYADVCGHFDARSLLVDTYGTVQAVQLASGQWITMPDLHHEISLDIDARAETDTSFVYEAKGWIEGKVQATADATIDGASRAGAELGARAQSTGHAIVQGAQSAGSSIMAGFEASLRFFADL